MERQWLQNRLHLLQHRLDGFEVNEKSPSEFEVVITTRIAPPVTAYGMAVVYRYLISGEGSVLLEVSGTPEGKWPEYIPRIGLQLEIAHAHRVEWYGPGPGESYIDSKEAARVGLWKRSVWEMETPYIFPQENGNRHRVQRVAFLDSFGNGLKVFGQPTLDFSIHRYTPMDYQKARHRHELTARPNWIVHLDYAHDGLGSNSCGPSALPQHRLRTEPFTFRLLMKG
jgi:beta-galactosidase/evolved beta-galactosidase subunit alpha